MPVISGDLRLVTDRLDTVTSVSVRARETRAQGSGLVLGHNDPVEVDGGVVRFDALPGPAVLALSHGGMVSETVPLLIGEGDMSLADAVRAASLADTATLSELERLAAQAVSDLAEVRRLRGEVREDATAATDAAGRAAGSASTASTAAADAEADRVQAGEDRAAAGASAVAAGRSESNAGQSATDAGAAAGRSEAAQGKAEAGASTATGAANTASQKAGEAAQSAKAAADSEKRAGEIAATGVPDATTTAKGKIRLAGDLAGTADAPTVPGLTGKADKQATDAALAGKADNGHKHVKTDITDLPTVTSTAAGNALVQRTGSGQVTVPATPSATTDAASRQYVDVAVSGRTPPAVVVTTVPATTVAGTIYYETG